MKKLLTILLSLTFLSLQCTFSQTANAENTTYLRVIDQATPFYSDRLGENLLFYLPYTYYVKTIGEYEEFYHVECYGSGDTILLDGYVPKNKLFDDDLSVESPFLTQSLQTINTTVLYQDSAMQDSIQYVFEGRTLKYYGEYPSSDGSKCFYVSYNNRIGYVKETDVAPFSIENHPNELTFIKKDPPLEPEIQEEESTDTTSKTTTDLKIIIIACLIIAGFIAVAISVKKSPKIQDNSSYYEETE